MVSHSSKFYILSPGTTSTSRRSVALKGFLDSMAAVAHAVHSYFKQEGKDIIYINVMYNLSVDCDCDSSPATPKKNVIDYRPLPKLCPVTRLTVAERYLGIKQA